MYELFLLPELCGVYVQMSSYFADKGASLNVVVNIWYEYCSCMCETNMVFVKQVQLYILFRKLTVYDCVENCLNSSASKFIKLSFVPREKRMEY